MRNVSEIQELIIDQQELIDNQPNGTTVEKKEGLRLNREMNELKKELEEAVEAELKAERADKLRRSAQIIDRPLVEGAVETLEIIGTSDAPAMKDRKGILHVSRVHTTKDGSEIWVRVMQGTAENPMTLEPVPGADFDKKKHSHLIIRCRKAKSDGNLYWNWLSYTENPVMTEKAKVAMDTLAMKKAQMDLLASYPVELQESMVKLLLAS